jgi:hypothetical protein
MEQQQLINGRPFRAGKPFRCFRDPGRKYFGFINKICVTYTDGKEPVGEAMTLAAFNRLTNPGTSGR